MKKIALLLFCIGLTLTGCSDDDGYKRGTSHASMMIDGVLYEFEDFHTGYVTTADENGDPMRSLYTRGDWVANTAEHREHFVMRLYSGGALHNALRVASLVVEDVYYSEGWSMPDDAPWNITFIQNDDEGVQATFEGIIRNGGTERVVTDGVINITYRDDNYGEGNSEFP